ncbi:MAG: MGMT family protein [Planctomycetales bacterium]
MRNPGKKSADRVSTLDVMTFITPFGWCGLAGENGTLHAVACGEESPADVMRVLEQKELGVEFRERNWSPELRRLIERYARGEKVDFRKVKVALPALTEFQQKVVAATRKIPHGQTQSYGDLAQAAGFPRAARAVGSVMRANRFPIVIPCHRVVASQGKLGGYTNRRGICLKEELLRLEGSWE